LYFDTAYVAKFYLKEPESQQVRDLVMHFGPVRSSALAIPELHCVFHRRMREGAISITEARKLAISFDEHINQGRWLLAPLGDRFLRRTAASVLSAPSDTFLRSADAIHLVTAQELGESEIWTSDRHMLAAAPFFGLSGRTL
jgi:predicted nucleic acid-binding protein